MYEHSIKMPKSQSLQLHLRWVCAALFFHCKCFHLVLRHLPQLQQCLWWALFHTCQPHQTFSVLADMEIGPDYIIDSVTNICVLWQRKVLNFVSWQLTNQVCHFPVQVCNCPFLWTNNLVPNLKHNMSMDDFQFFSYSYQIPWQDQNQKCIRLCLNTAWLLNSVCGSQPQTYSRPLKTDHKCILVSFKMAYYIN